MIKKFNYVKQYLIEAIHNSVILKKSKKETYELIISDIPVSVEFHDVSAEMIKEFIEILYELAYYEIFKQKYEE